MALQLLRVGAQQAQRVASLHRVGAGRFSLFDGVELQRVPFSAVADFVQAPLGLVRVVLGLAERGPPALGPADSRVAVGVWGKAKTATQMVALLLLLLARGTASPGALWRTGIALLYLAALLTCSSAIGYVGAAAGWDRG